MRTKKYRAWDGKQMREMFAIFLKNNEADFVSFNDFSTNPEPNSCLIDYIGLLDITSKEIYENDILQFDDTAIGGGKGTGVVKYCNDLELCDIPGYALFVDGLYHSMPINRIIVGNIFETKEVEP